MLSRKRLAPAGLIAAIALLLSGCESFSSDDLGLQLRDGALVVGICQPLEAAGVLMEERGEGEWSTFFEHSNPIRMRPGDEIWVGVEDATVAIDRLPQLKPGDDISVLLGVSTKDQLQGFFVVPDDGMPTGEWLRPDGSQARELCADASQ
jgi:hypothetical protein